MLLALGLAAAVGLEREFSRQEAGLRTYMLVGLGSCLFVLLGTYGVSDFAASAGGQFDGGRVISYVVTGVGFLGAGAIMQQRRGVTGLTTAASMWVTAAVGAAAAVGEYTLACLVTGLVVLSLWPVGVMSKRLEARGAPTVRLRVALAPSGQVADLVRVIEGQGSRAASVTVRERTDGREVDLVVERAAQIGEVLDALAAVAGVRRAGHAR